MSYAHPAVVCPRLKTQGAKASSRRSHSAEWKKWDSYADALKYGNEAQVHCWQDFSTFRYVVAKHKTYDHMKVWEKALNTGDDSRYLRGIAGADTLILSPRESAKAQPLNELVLTPSGYKQMGELEVGDEVTTVCNATTVITAVSPQGIKPSYLVTFSDGSAVECSLDHLWYVRHVEDYPFDYVALSLKDIREFGLFTPDHKPCFYIPTVESFKFTDRAIVSVEYVRDTQMQCITVAHPSQLYITRDRIVTHNSTYLAQWAAYQYGIHYSPWVRLALKVLGVSYNLDTARPRSRQIQSIIESDRYQRIFPWVRPSKKKWAETEWMLDMGWAGLSETEEQYSYVCAGLTGAINSRRCHLVLPDDLIKSPSAIQSHQVRETMISNWETAIAFTRYDGSRAVSLGTRMTAQDIYCTTFTPAKRWFVIEQSALLTKPDGTEYSYWEPESETAPGTPLTRLQQEREDNIVTFTFQRQNKLIRISEQSIEPGLIVRSHLPKKFEILVLGVDLSAGTKESNDYTTMVLGGLADDKYYIIDAWEDRIMGNTPKLDTMVEIWSMWKHLLPTTTMYSREQDDWVDVPTPGLQIWFDSSAYGLSLKGDYDDHIIRRLGIHDWTIRAVPASGRGSKLERLRKHTGLFDNHLIFFNQYGRTMPDGRKPMGRLIEQITEFGTVPHDDLADAFELCATGMRSHLPLTKGNY